MCGIAASFDITIAWNFHLKHADRGTKNISASILSIQNDEIDLEDVVLINEEGDLPSQQTNKFYIIHSQAPTGDTDDSNIHPAVDSLGNALWHNGLIKADEVHRLNSIFNTDFNWDTRLLLHTVQTDARVLGEVDGSFACFLYDIRARQLYYFRNQIAPLFQLRNTIFSSTPSSTLTSTEHGKIYNFITGKSVVTFNTTKNPYFF